MENEESTKNVRIPHILCTLSNFLVFFGVWFLKHPQSHLRKIEKKEQKQLIKGMCNYSLDKQYSCELYINTNPLSWVRIEGAQSMENCMTFFPMS